MKKTLCTVLLTLLAGSSFGDLASYVNPFAGALCAGHTTPAAVRPFGMISPGPTTGLADWERCSGYYYPDTTIMGFAHTHLLGIGVPSYCCLAIMPVTGDAGMGSKSAFSHDREAAEPGYYKVHLDSYDILAEMTCTKRAAIHRFTFPSSPSPRILIDIEQGSDPTQGDVLQLDNSTLQGRVYCVRRKNHYQWFHMQFSSPFASYTRTPEGAYVTWPETADKTLLVKVAISFVSKDNAKANLDAELPGWDFDAVKAAARKAWNDELAKVEVEGGTDEQIRTFYSNLYFAFWHPQLSSDVNGQYRSLSAPNTHGEVATDANGHYTSLPMWDVFRSEHPLLILLQPALARKVVNTMLADYRAYGSLPKWKYAYIEHGGMTGRHAVPVLAEAYCRGIPFDLQKASEAAVAEGTHKMSRDYMTKGFDRNTGETLEWAYDDWSIAQLAKAAGATQDHDRFMARSMNYTNLFNPKEGFMCPRDPDTKEWIHDPYDPRRGYPQYVEGNGWHYTWSVFHDIQGLVNLMGGDAAFEETLDGLWTAQGTPGCPPDVVPEVGNYAHSNEPCHHVPYLYNYIGKPWKTQERVRQIADIYRPDPHYGIDGNNDAGAISSWYVFSALGFYPVTPGTSEYVIGTPLFAKATLHLAGGDLTVMAKNNAPANKYIQSMTLNGEDWNKTYLPYEAIKNGGSIVFTMGPEPSPWGTTRDARPFSVSPDLESGVNMPGRDGGL
jgi:predicted alpha-1,2-mannosidase